MKNRNWNIETANTVYNMKCTIKSIPKYKLDYNLSKYAVVIKRNKN